MNRRMGTRLLWAVLAGSAADLAGLGLIAAAAWLITRAAEQPPLAALSVAIVATRAFATGKGVFRYAERLTGHDVALRAQAGTRERLYEALVPPQRPRHGGADLLSRMVDDTEAVQDLLVRCLLPAAAAAMAGLAAVVVGLAILPSAALVLVAGLLVAGVALPAGTAAAARRWSARIAPARAALAGRVADLVHGSADLAAYGADDEALAKALAADESLAALERRQARVHAAALAGGTLVQGLTVAGVVLLAQGAGASSVGTAVLALTSLVAFEPVLPLAAAGERMAGITAALRRLRDVRSASPATTEPAAPAPRPEAPLTIEIDDLVVRHATSDLPEVPPDAAHGGRPAPDGAGRPAPEEAGEPAPGRAHRPALDERAAPERAGRPALDGVSLRLTPGKRVAIVGPSGAGKSTLLAALMRLVEPESGRITVNGVGLGDLAGDDVRALMTGLTQDPYIFRATLRDNLRLAGPDADDEALRRAVRDARLDGWVERTGWDAELGEDGRTVSGGQLQRLALARALLYDPPVLLLDEPAEALDEETADRLMADLLDVTRDRTTLLVTHRLKGLESVDEIVVLEEGRVVQRGRHDELVSVPGYYRDLWESEVLTRR
ncbi:ATP-binding cassette subfamily C protein/ATP-binding cassette subfamily C protein CydC [Nonomuraea thailandensis]|uniref:ATP-binding cassette subfamily C protein/ATP-binding cassette subfamily C protein CydC n=1 Tax=Nonomuraea thailandensis TaxID=1188745 RepID=A0A9X2K366_9ACTN|nr:ATP-binding cassette domain-containing protein [Nonomuraea thailandensis]MCP2359137.1 ATP-binding cassette subfamily C protein/ATP-binding cassette subfamily C protein CydC [Nonomuraea thailandensis]